MKAEERVYFEKLSASHREDAKTFQKPSYTGWWNSIIDKYSDKAHFLYELLQNADDAGATYAQFILEEKRLIFKHNGTRHFSITNPDTEGEDKKNGTLGDINAITGIAFSNKDKQNKIGKFGVGFKAVFQYTNTPYIWEWHCHYE